jgi:hypothetical protein
MWVAQLRYPGAWIEGMSRDDAFRAQSLLSTAEDALADAALSLTFFEACRATPHGPKRWEQRRAREQELRARVSAKYESQLGDVPESERWIALLPMREAIESEAKMLVWQEGDLPESYEGRLPFLHPRGFLFALDTLANLLRVMAKEAWAPAPLRTIKDDWMIAFPELKHVRDTAHHVEDRVRGLDRDGKPLQLGPLVNEMINAPNGGVLLIDSLMNNRYGCTLADGTYGEVEISGISLAAAIAIVQRAIEAFQWRGPERFVPH